MRTLVVLAVMATGCAVSGAAVTSAIVNTAIATGASAHSRSQGGCYAACPVGTSCNKETGYCDPMPCRGLCRADEQCDQTGPVERCTPRQAPLDLHIEEKKPELVTPQ